MKERRAGLGLLTASAVLGLAVGSEALGDMILFDTGPPRPVLFDATNQGNFAETFLGLSSGYLSGTSPQRWLAQAFTLPKGQWKLKMIEVNYFIPAGGEFANLHYVIWSRNGQAAPVDGDQLVDATVAAPPGLDDPDIDGVEDWLKQIPVNIDLAGGDYYLTIYGDDGLGNVANAAWLTNADNGINLLDGGGSPFAWRSQTFPFPGFVAFTIGPNTLQQTPGNDPNDVYNTAFTIYAVPGPGALPLLAVAALIGRRRRR